MAILYESAPGYDPRCESQFFASKRSTFNNQEKLNLPLSLCIKPQGGFGDMCCCNCFTTNPFSVSYSNLQVFCGQGEFILPTSLPVMHLGGTGGTICAPISTPDACSWFAQETAYQNGGYVVFLNGVLHYVPPILNEATLNVSIQVPPLPSFLQASYVCHNFTCSGGVFSLVDVGNTGNCVSVDVTWPTVITVSGATCPT